MLLSGLIRGNFFILKIPRLAIILVRKLYEKSAVLFTAYLFLCGMLKMAKL